MHAHEKHRDHPHGDGLSAQSGGLRDELVHHLPFSVSAVAIGLIFAGVICFLSPSELDNAPCTLAQHEAPDPLDLTLEGEAALQAAGATHAHDHADEHAHHGGHSHDHGHAGHDHSACEANPFFYLFHLFHPVHMLFSAAATTAMFWRYERRAIKAIIVGLIGAVGVCGLSDIVMPHISLSMLGKGMPWHVCVIEHPEMVLSFAAVGIVIGLAASRGVRQSTFFSHSLHVLASTMASIFYLIGPLGRLGWIDSVGTVFLFVIVAVMVPCCLSDIVFPLLLARKARQDYSEEHTGCGCHG